MPPSKNNKFLVTAQKAARLAEKIILDKLSEISKNDIYIKQVSK